MQKPAAVPSLLEFTRIELLVAAGFPESRRQHVGVGSPACLPVSESVIGPEEVRLFTCPEGEHRNFLDCVRSREDPYFPVDIGARDHL